MTHSKHRNKCPKCFNVLGQSAGNKYCPRCGYTTKPAAERYKKEPKKRTAPAKPFVSSIKGMWMRFAGTRKLRGER